MARACCYGRFMIVDVFAYSHCISSELSSSTKVLQIISNIHSFSDSLAPNAGRARCY